MDRVKRLLKNVEAEYQRLAPIVEQAILAEPGVMNRERQRVAGEEIEQRLDPRCLPRLRSSMLFAKSSPENVGSTSAGRFVTDKLPAGAADAVNQVPLGGVSADNMAERVALRENLKSRIERFV